MSHPAVPQSLQQNGKANKRLEILCDNYYYDITNFAERHPGGNIIYYYTAEGEDATQAIQQFHNRSISKVETMLKAFPRRQAKDDECTFVDKTKLERHRALTDDFSKLFVEMQKEGLFEPSYWRIYWRMTECFLLMYLAYNSFLSSSILINIFGSVCAGVGGGRAGWLMHEGGHHSLTGKPKTDKFIESFFLGIFLGLSGGWWNRGHNKHHAMPQRLHHDVDLNTMPFLAYTTKVVKDSKQGKSFMIQNQTWLFLSLDCMLGYLAWKLYICPKNAIKRGDYLDLFMMSLHWALQFAFIQSFWTYLLAYWIGSNYMFGNFALSHTHLPVTETQTHWVEYALSHTANIKSNLLVDWWMGYLNFQIEHHLFPTLPQFRCYQVKDRVKALAKKYDLPYHDISYFQAWYITLKNFSNVAKELRMA